MVFSTHYVLVDLPEDAPLRPIRPGSAIYGTSRLPVRVLEHEHETWSCRLMVEHRAPSELRLEFLSHQAPLKNLQPGSIIEFYRSSHSCSKLTVVSVPMLHRP